MITSRAQEVVMTEDEKRRLESVAAEATSLRIIVGALIDLFPDPELLRSTIELHAKLVLSGMPVEIEENRVFVETVWRKLNSWWPLLQAGDQ